jgi:hypothetical protein
VRNELPAEAANALQRRGLAAPARILLEAHRPLLPLMTEAGFFLGPVLRPLLGSRYASWLHILEHDEAYDALIEALDDAESR